MLLEKLKQHAGKFLFFTINILLIVVGVMYIKQRELEKTLTNINAANSDVVSQEIPVGSQAAQDAIAADRKQKLDSVANNQGTVQATQTVPVTKVIPGSTQTFSVPASTSSSTSKSTSTKTKTS